MAIPLHTIFLNEFEVGQHHIRIDQEAKLGLGGTVWEAALVLSRFLHSQPALLEGATSILELGSGTGLCGLAVAKFFTGTVTITDLPLYQGQLHHNAELNGSPANLTITDLDWRAPKRLGNFDLILGTDIVYDEVLHVPLLDAIEANMSPNTTVLLCNERRSSLDLKFYRRWQERGWTLTAVPQVLLDPQLRCEEMRIFKGTKLVV
jgi:predicted nicotinamide N-methyase